MKTITQLRKSSRFINLFILFIIGCFYGNAQVLDKDQINPNKPETELLSERLWDVKAYHPEAKFIKIKAIDKEQAMKLIEQDLVEMENVSKRWDSDMNSDSWLSKNTRPLTLMYLTLASTILIIIDSFHTMFDVDVAWVELLKTLLITVYVAYFGSRGAEKITNNINAA